MTKSMGRYRKSGRWSQFCKGCGKKMMFTHYYAAKAKKYCTHGCYTNAMKGVSKPSALKGTIKVPKVDRECVWCGGMFRIKWWRKTKYCSRSCYDASKVGKKHTQETKKKMSAASKAAGVLKRLHKDPEFQKKRIKGIVKSPNKAERKLNRIIQGMYHNEYRFTGNGELIID